MDELTINPTILLETIAICGACVFCGYLLGRGPRKHIINMDSLQSYIIQISLLETLLTNKVVTLKKLDSYLMKKHKTNYTDMRKKVEGLFKQKPAK